MRVRDYPTDSPLSHARRVKRSGAKESGEEAWKRPRYFTFSVAATRLRANLSLHNKNFETGGSAIVT